MSSLPAAPPRLRVALLRRSHGVRGEIRAEPCGGGLGRFRRGLRLQHDGGRTLTVTAARDGGAGTVLLRFAGVTTPEAARELCGGYVTVEAAQARALGRDEWFVWQLVGLRVRDQSGADLGVVHAVEPGVASDVLVVRDVQGELHRHPMVRAFVRGVDLDAGVLTLLPLPEVDA